MPTLKIDDVVAAKVKVPFLKHLLNLKERLLK